MGGHLPDPWGALARLLGAAAVAGALMATYLVAVLVLGCLVISSM